MTRTKLITSRNLADMAARLLPTVDVDGKIVSAHDTDPEREQFVPARLSPSAVTATAAAAVTPTAVAANLPARLADTALKATSVTAVQDAITAGTIVVSGGAKPLDVLIATKPAVRLAPALSSPARVAGLGHGWTGGTADDTAVKMLGDRSYRLTTGGTGLSTHAVSSPTWTAQDWSKRIPRLIFRVDDPTKLNWLTVKVLTAGGGIWQVNLMPNTGSGANMIAGEWCVVTLARQRFTVNAATPDWTQVTGVQVSVRDLNTGPVNFWTHGIDLLPDRSELYPNGVFILEADDGYASQKSLLLPLADSLGVRVTLPLIVERITGGAAGITVADLKAFERSGHQLSCHAYSSAFHGTAGATAAQAEADFTAQQQWYVDNGLTVGALDYALCPGTGDRVPEGDLLEALRRRFRSVRWNSGMYEAAQPGEPHKLRSLLYAGQTTVLTTHIDASAAPGGCFIFAMHGAVAGATNGTDGGLQAPAIDNLKAALQYAAGKGMAFRTRSDWLAGR